MFNLNNDKNKKVHFIGIGGISMSGLAEILLFNGYSVSGSDRSASHITEKLEKMGAKVYIGHNEKNVHGSDLVVYTAAIKEDNPEYQEAKKLNIPMVDRAIFLGDLMRGHSKVIAVSGSHGKTTATSMMSLILLKADLDPTIMIGGELNEIGGNVKPGNSEYFIAEACEYKESFLKFFPNIGVILNIDADHLDYYKDIDEIEAAFLKFSKIIPQDGYLIGFAEDKRVENIASKAKCNILTYGFNDGDFTAADIEFDSLGFPSFKVLFKGKDFYKFKLNVPGKQNILNALASIATSYALGIDMEKVSQGLLEFKGTHRRFERKGIYNGAIVIDDYAHHPAEIKATISAALNIDKGRLFVVFQPHTYTRLKALFDDFSMAFNGVDKLILTDVYAAREKDDGTVSSEMLSKDVCKNGVDSIYIKDFNSIVDYLKANLKEEDIIITMGAGNVFEIGDILLK